MNIPNQIKVGGIKYKISIVEDGINEHAAAEINTEKCTIKIRKGNPQFMAVSFWHEILHAINMEMPEERVEFLAQALNQIAVDNPKIFEGGVHND
jgi:hypothetical protein